MLKFYAAGRFTGQNKVQEIIEKLQKSGNYQVTHDWTRHVPDKNDSYEEQRRKIAILDINGVKECDILIVWMDDREYPYRRTWTEIGAALVLDRPVYLITNNIVPSELSGWENTFFHHSNIKIFATIDEMVQFVSK